MMGPVKAATATNSPNSSCGVRRRRQCRDLRQGLKLRLNLRLIFAIVFLACSSSSTTNNKNGHNIQTLPFIISATASQPKSQPKNVVVSGGLDNLGNTCYLNAQLECAYHIPKVRNCILVNEEEGGEEHPNTAARLSLQNVFEVMYEASQRGNGNILLTPSSSTRTLCHGLGINVYEQQDSQEFWKLLLPELQHSTLTELYKGHFESYIVALDGSGREKRRQETFFDISLEVSDFDHIHDSLENRFKSGETLSVKDGNGWRPEKGADKVDALKGYTLHAAGLPDVLQLHLMRFKYDMMSGEMSKINDRFIFPKELDLAKVCHGDQVDNIIFDLQSVVIHAGEYGSGHYYAYVRPDVISDKWYRFDDNRVTEVTFKAVRDDAFGGCSRRKKSEKLQKSFWSRFFRSSKTKENYGWGGKNSCAYMLQYVKRSEIHSLYSDY